MIEANQRKTVPIRIVKHGKDTAPTLYPRRMEKADSPFRPLIELGINVFGNESNMLRTADKAVFFRARPGGRDDKDCVAVRGRNRRPSKSRLNLNIIGNGESKLVHEKLEAQVLIANIHRRALKTQIRTLSIEANDRTLNPLWRGRVFHRVIIGRRSRTHTQWNRAHEDYTCAP